MTVDLQQKSFIFQETEYIYFRPNQVRNIPLKSKSNRGFIPSLKPHLKGVILDYESQLEHDFLLLLDHDPNCYDLQTQPFKLKYISKSGTETIFYPDCWAIFNDGSEYIFEIKTENNYQKLFSDENWQLKLKSIQQFCNRKNFKYMIFTEKKIHCVRLDIIKDLIMAAKHYSPSHLDFNIGNILMKMKNILKNAPKTIKELSIIIEPSVCFKLDKIISVLKNQIYFGHISINWNLPLSESKISLDSNSICPMYYMKENIADYSEGYSEKDNDEKNQPMLTENQKKSLESKLSEINPIINQYGNTATKKIIENYCEKNKLPFNRIYRYYLLWKKEGKEGLIPKRVISHKKSHLSPKVESLLQTAIEEWKSAESQQMKPVYNELIRKCQKLDLKTPSYKTFRIRTQKLRATEKRGKFQPKSQITINKGLRSTYLEGKYPGCVIQMDHTLLDIWLVDSFTKQPIGRPWFTIGIDVFSRSIWGYFLSFEAPSQESVTQAILNGLINKNELKEWKIFSQHLRLKSIDTSDYYLPCYGLPARIQVDNGKDFRANSVKNLCMSLNISLEFRPIKTPEFGGFIESIWDTINDRIRGQKLDGRVYPIKKTREKNAKPKYKNPIGYNPKENASLTMNNFSEWLFSFLFGEYQTTSKAKQSAPPNHLWRNGLSGSNFQPLGGALRIMDIQEYRFFNYDSRITKNSRLSQKGFRYKNILYTGDWLIEARKERILDDGKNYEFKISHWDIRYIQMIDPLTQEIKTLEAYNYDGDDRIKKFILQGLGKIFGFKSFSITLNMIKQLRKEIKKNLNENLSSNLILESMNEKIKLNSSLNKNERLLIEELAQTQNGREQLSQAQIIAEMDEKPIEITDQCEKDIIYQINPDSEDIEDDEIKPYPTSWDDACSNEN